MQVQTGISILNGYAPPSGAYDEVFDGVGNTRQHWSTVTDKLAQIGADAFRQRAAQVRRIVQENGVTYNAHGDTEGSHRQWVVDPLPMIVSYDEWSAIERGMGQRVRLLNSVLADIYGMQKLLRGGQLPASLVHGNPHFLRPCHGLQPLGGVFVHLYAADLARAPDGSWRVLSDRIEVPSGIGYALENRFITQQALPDVFRAAGPVRLRPFFQRMLESFETLVQRRTEQPCIVLLSPGPNFESYFEQAFFARNLGYPLVEGADLTTRDNRVYLKTVAGLKQVDVIMRNVSSLGCDPLELDSTSTLGVSGLVQAARAGNVAVANSLGAGVMESPAMPAFLGGLCKQMLGEDLSVPSAQTWWCGRGEDLDYVRRNLSQLVVKPVFRNRSGEAMFGPLLDRNSLEQLDARIAASPNSWCAQEMLSSATVPALEEHGLAQPRNFLMRVFMVATKNGYEMMPGALTRVAPKSGGCCSVSMAEGGTSKDTWMIAPPDMPLRDHPLPHTGPVRIRRSTAELTSRDADNLFWMGRYMERADSMTRLLRVLISEVQDCPDATVPPNLTPFLNIAFALKPGSGEADMMDLDEAETKLDELLYEPDAAAGLVSHILAMHGTAAAVKERLSLDAVGIINQLARQITDEQDAAQGRNHGLRLNNIGMLLAGIAGTMAENMTRAMDWRFLDLGRRIERAHNIAELLLHVFSAPAPHSDAMLANLLICADSRYTYASRYLTNLKAEAVVDLLLTDASNPRSIAFQTQAIAAHVANLPVAAIEEPQTRRRRLALFIASEVDLADVRELLTPDSEGQVPMLTRLMARVSDRLLALSEQLASHYFAHSDNKRILSSRSF
ncbi:MAG: circularly permuted type 2 ATP-grasp protein [Opitutales bacterium]